MKRFFNIKDFITDFKKSHHKIISEQELIVSWPQVVGKTISACSRPYLLKNNILHVKVSDHMYLTELTYARDKILTKYNTLFPDSSLKDIIFRFSKLPPENKIAPIKIIEDFSLEDIEVTKADGEIPVKTADNELNQKFSKLKTTWAACQKKFALLKKDEIAEESISYRPKQMLHTQAALSIYPKYGYRSDYITFEDTLQDFL